MKSVVWIAIACVVAISSSGSSQRLVDGDESSARTNRQRRSDTGRTREKYVQGPQVVERDSIIRSVLAVNPGATRKAIVGMVQPLLAAAGIPAGEYRSLAVNISQIRRDLQVVRKKVRLSPQQIALLEEELAGDPTQPVRVVWEKMYAIWGDETPSPSGLANWWAAAKAAEFSKRTESTVSEPTEKTQQNS